MRAAPSRPGWSSTSRKSFAEAGGFRTPKRALDPIHRADSLDAPLGDDENSRTLWEAAPDPGAAQDFQNAENRVWVEQLREALDRALDELSDGWAEILRRSYYAGQTKKQIAACLGIGDATVCRRKKKALHVLRQRQELRRFLQD